MKYNRLPHIVGLVAVYQPLTYLTGSFSVYLLYFFLILTLWTLKKEVQILPINRLAPKTINYIYILLLWILYEYIRGLFIAESYWDYKFMATSFFSFSLILFVFVGLRISNVISIYSFWLKYILWLFPLYYIIPGLTTNMCIMPLGYLLIIFWLLPSKWKKICLLLSISLIISDLGARSNLVKLLVSLIFGLMISLSFFKKEIIIKTMHFLFLTLPFIFLCTSILNIFNPLKLEQYFNSDLTYIRVENNGKKVKENLLSDSRSFLYTEIFLTMKEQGDWLTGVSPAKGYNTNFEIFKRSLTKITGKAERYGSEVGVLDVLLWFGIIGLLLYYFLFLLSSYYAIYKSKNIYIKIIGLYISFDWMWSWVWEKPSYSSFYLFNMLMIGVCLSKEFRNLKDKEFSTVVSRIF